MASTKQKQVSPKVVRIVRFLEFFIVGVIFGILEDLLAIVFATGHPITLRVFLIATFVAVPFAVISELFVDSPRFRRDIHRAISRMIPEAIEEPITHITETQDPLSRKRHEQKEQKKAAKKKIIKKFESKKKLSNKDVQKLLGVSEATVTRYMEELQKERKIEQIGKTGRSVYYRINGSTVG